MPTKCYYFFDNNQILFKEIFEESMRQFMPKMTLYPVEFEYKSQSSNFGTIDFRNLMLEKVLKVCDIIKEHISDGTEIIVSDIDIIIYKNFEDNIKLGDADIMLQKESRTSGINTGFILFKCSQKIYDYWRSIGEAMTQYKEGVFINEQEIVNNTISTSGLKWVLFDDTIWAFSNQPKPENICLHHANCTVPFNGKSSFQLKCMQMISELWNSDNVLKDILIPTLQKYI